MDRIRLLIASNESSARRGLAAIFFTEEIFEVLGEFTLDESGGKAASCQPDVILLDVPNDIIKYRQKISDIKNSCPCSLVLAVVGDENNQNVAEMLETGLDGCVPRGIMRGCLVKTVELACRAGLLCLPASYKKIVSSSRAVKANKIGQLPNGTLCNDVLTKREMEILQLIAKNFSNREIAGKLFISEPTVKTHVSSILRKLGQKNRAQAIVFSYRTGLINEPETAAIK